MPKCKECKKGGLFTKVNKNGVCYQCLLHASNEAYKKLVASITPEMKDALALAEISANLSGEIEAKQKEKNVKIAEIASLNREIAGLKKQIISDNETIELEEFALYKPKYDFQHAEQFKEALEKIRDEQKEMIKAKTAATGATNWTVNNNATQGKKMVNDTTKLCLRSFNNECETAVSQVKFNTFDRCLERMQKACDSINTLGKILNITISPKYFALKEKELRLALEYQMKKQEEKEELRALREQQREEAKLAKEIEEARREAEKEKKHYEQALAKLDLQLQTCKTDDERNGLLAKKNEISGRIDDITTKLADIDYRQANQKAGYVYIISNIGSFGEGVYKIGMTRRLDPEDRIDELGDASVPFIFDIHAMIFSEDAPKLEAALHRAFADRRVNRMNYRKEYFRVSLAEIKNVVTQNHDKTVEFKDNPEAEDYRESSMIGEEKIA